jgi:hypothetical protein
MIDINEEPELAILLENSQSVKEEESPSMMNPTDIVVVAWLSVN